MFLRVFKVKKPLETKCSIIDAASIIIVDKLINYICSTEKRRCYRTVHLVCHDQYQDNGVTRNQVGCGCTFCELTRTFSIRLDVENSYNKNLLNSRSNFFLFFSAGVQPTAVSNYLFNHIVPFFFFKIVSIDFKVHIFTSVPFYCQA